MCLLSGETMARQAVAVVLFMMIILCHCFPVAAFLPTTIGSGSGFNIGPLPLHEQKNNVLTSLRTAGFHRIAAFIELSGAVATLPKNATLFAPDDEAFAAMVFSSFFNPILLYHFASRRLSFGDLLVLPQGTRIGTFLPGRTIMVTSRPDSNSVEIDGVAITVPDIYQDESIAVHGMAAIFNPDRFGIPALKPVQPIRGWNPGWWSPWWKPFFPGAPKQHTPSPSPPPPSSSPQPNQPGAVVASPSPSEDSESQRSAITPKSVGVGPAPPPSAPQYGSQPTTVTSGAGSAPESTQLERSSGGTIAAVPIECSAQDRRVPVRLPGRVDDNAPGPDNNQALGRLVNRRSSPAPAPGYGPVREGLAPRSQAPRFGTGLAPRSHAPASSAHDHGAPWTSPSTASKFRGYLDSDVAAPVPDNNQAHGGPVNRLPSPAPAHAYGPAARSQAPRFGADLAPRSRAPSSSAHDHGAPTTSPSTGSNTISGDVNSNVAAPVPHNNQGRPLSPSPSPAPAIDNGRVREGLAPRSQAPRFGADRAPRTHAPVSSAYEHGAPSTTRNPSTGSNTIIGDVNSNIPVPVPYNNQGRPLSPSPAQAPAVDYGRVREGLAPRSRAPVGTYPVPSAVAVPNPYENQAHGGPQNPRPSPAPAAGYYHVREDLAPRSPTFSTDVAPQTHAPASSVRGRGFSPSPGPASMIHSETITGSQSTPPVSYKAPSPSAVHTGTSPAPSRDISFSAAAGIPPSLKVSTSRSPSSSPAHSDHRNNGASPSVHADGVPSSAYVALHTPSPSSTHSAHGGVSPVSANTIVGANHGSLLSPRTPSYDIPSPTPKVATITHRQSPQAQPGSGHLPSLEDSDKLDDPVA